MSGNLYAMKRNGSEGRLGAIPFDAVELSSDEIFPVNKSYPSFSRSLLTLNIRTDEDADIFDMTFTPQSPFATQHYSDMEINSPVFFRHLAAANAAAAAAAASTLSAPTAHSQNFQAAALGMSTVSATTAPGAVISSEPNVDLLMSLFDVLDRPNGNNGNSHPAAASSSGFGAAAAAAAMSSSSSLNNPFASAAHHHNSNFGTEFLEPFYNMDDSPLMAAMSTSTSWDDGMDLIA